MNGDIISQGSIPFSQFQNTALYHPQAGFYSTTSGAGRQRDFLTSPEVGELFALVLAKALDTWWQQWGRPNPFYVIEGGAGSGTLAAGIIKHVSVCARALRYVTVEQSFALRSEQNQKLPMVEPKQLLDATARMAKSPVSTALGSMPTGVFNGVVIANELLDNLAVDLFERRGDDWREVRIGMDKQGDLTEVLTRPTEAQLELLAPFASFTADGARVPLQHEAKAWLDGALELIGRGKVLAFRLRNDN